MKQTQAWNIAVEALRLHFLQGNSQCHDVDKFIEEQTIETLHAIRETLSDYDTTTLVKEAKCRN